MIPIATQRALCAPKLDPGAFTPTEWGSSENKAQFGDRLLRFIAEDCPERLFTKALYKRLNLTFGHIAHYSRAGFYDYFFSDRRGRIEFLDQTSSFRCYGDPAFTFSDLERAVVGRLRRSGILDWQRRLLAQETAAREKALLAALLAKHGAPTSVGAAARFPRPPTVQTDLFGG